MPLSNVHVVQKEKHKAQIVLFETFVCALYRIIIRIDIMQRKVSRTSSVDSRLKP